MPLGHQLRECWVRFLLEGGNAARGGTMMMVRQRGRERGRQRWHHVEEDNNNGGFYYCVIDGHDEDHNGNSGGIVRGSYMGYALGKVGKGRTIPIGCREDARTDEGKGNRGELAGPLLNIATPWAMVGAAGIAIIAVLCVATV